MIKIHQLYALSLATIVALFIAVQPVDASIHGSVAALCQYGSSYADGCNTVGATTAGTISGQTLTVPSSPAPTGTFALGQNVVGAGIPPWTYIIACTTCGGGADTYTISNSATVSSGETITASSVAPVANALTTQQANFFNGYANIQNSISVTYYRLGGAASPNNHAPYHNVVGADYPAGPTPIPNLSAYHLTPLGLKDPFDPYNWVLDNAASIAAGGAAVIPLDNAGGSITNEGCSLQNASGLWKLLCSQSGAQFGGPIVFNYYDFSNVCSSASNSYTTGWAGFCAENTSFAPNQCAIFNVNTNVSGVGVVITNSVFKAIASTCNSSSVGLASQSSVNVTEFIFNNNICFGNYTVYTNQPGCAGSANMKGPVIVEYNFFNDIQARALQVASIKSVSNINGATIVQYNYLNGLIGSSGLHGELLEGGGDTTAILTESFNNVYLPFIANSAITSLLYLSAGAATNFAAVNANYNTLINQYQTPAGFGGMGSAVIELSYGTYANTNLSNNFIDPSGTTPANAAACIVATSSPTFTNEVIFGSNTSVDYTDNMLNGHAVGNGVNWTGVVNATSGC